MFCSVPGTLLATLFLLNFEDDLLSVARFIADCFDQFQSGGDPS
jgi:hypothetical protein